MKEVLEAADEECKALWGNASLGYTESLGDPMLLQEIWNHYKERAKRELRRRGVAEVADKYADQDAIRITTCVPVEGIYISMLQLLDAGDNVICLAPAYQALYEIARSKGCVIHKWTPRYDEDKNFWEFSFKDLKQLLEQFSPSAGSERKVLKMLIVNSPHNPTGACFSQSQFDEMADLLVQLEQDTPPILFSDEMYSDILPSKPTNVAKKNSIVLSGLSKPWGMPGLRIGWLIVDNPCHFETITAFRDYTTLCLPPQSEILGIIALRNSERFLQRNREISKHNYLILQDFLMRNEKWFYSLNQHEHNEAFSRDEYCGVTLFSRLKPLGCANGSGKGHALDHLMSVPKLVEHLAQEHSICLVAGDFFEFADFPCVRFGIGRRSFEDALKHLEEALAKMR